MSDPSVIFEEHEQIPYEKVKVCPCCGTVHPRTAAFTIPPTLMTEELWRAIKARMAQEQRCRPDWTPVYSPNVVDPTSTSGRRTVY